MEDDTFPKSDDIGPFDVGIVDTKLPGSMMSVIVYQASSLLWSRATNTIWIEKASPFSLLGPGMKPSVQPLQETNVLLSIVHSISMPTTHGEGTPFVNWATLDILKLVLSDKYPTHSRLVVQTMLSMYVVIDVSSRPIVYQLFRHHNGLALAFKQIAYDVGIRTDDDRA